MNGFSLIHESNEFVVINNEMYMNKGYLCDELFKLNVNVMTIVVKGQ